MKAKVKNPIYGWAVTTGNVERVIHKVAVVSNRGSTHNIIGMCNGRQPTPKLADLRHRVCQLGLIRRERPSGRATRVNVTTPRSRIRSR